LIGFFDHHGAFKIKMGTKKNDVRLVVHCDPDPHPHPVYLSFYDDCLIDSETKKKSKQLLLPFNQKLTIPNPVQVIQLKNH
jgi:hypothetical protein